LQRHKDLAGQIDTAAGERRPEKEGLPTDHVTVKSLQTELATAKHRNGELNDRVQALERRLGAQGATMGPSVIDQHPVVLELRARLGRLEVELLEKDRGIDSLKDDVEVLRETNRSLVREYGLHATESRPH
jgi:predicted RNase H-like nuclease (RuvC/YqgF family)